MKHSDLCRGGVVLTGALMGVFVIACSLTPDTPANTMVALALDNNDGELDDDHDRLCDELKRHLAAGSGPLVADYRVWAEDEEAAYRSNRYPSGRSAHKGGENAAEVYFNTFERMNGEPPREFIAHVVKEDGRWKLCRIEADVDAPGE